MLLPKKNAEESRDYIDRITLASRFLWWPRLEKSMFKKTSENCAHGYENTHVLRLVLFVPLT